MWTTVTSPETRGARSRPCFMRWNVTVLWAWTAVPLDQLVLYRDPDPAGRRLAILFDGAGMTADRFSGDDTAVLFPAPIRIRDVPAGLPLAFVYSGEQCEILAESNGWIRIRTARLEGWVERRTVVEVRER